MKKMLLCALIAIAGINVNLVSQLEPLDPASQVPPTLNITTKVTNNTTKTILVRLGSTKSPGVARILKPGETKTFYGSCMFLIAIADIDANNIPAGLSNIDSLLQGVSNDDDAVLILNNYKNNVDYKNAISALTFNFVTVDNEPATCQTFIDIFNFTISEDANGKYAIKAENANLQNLSTPAINLTNGTVSAN